MSRIQPLSLLVATLVSHSLMAQPEVENSYSVLPYPELSELKPLPKRSQSSTVVSLPVSSAVTVASDSDLNEPLGQQVVVPASTQSRQATAQNATTQNSSDEPFGLDDLDLSGLDPEIARKVAAAMNNEPSDPRLRNADHIALESSEARYRGRLPALNFQTHMYSSDVNRRWIKVNGQELQEGDRLNFIQLLAIEPQSVTIRFDNDIIDIPALYEWGG
ncbi:general secretion pathway protein GspB [Vibrio chaetopteri]|uniref:general secretion pathway protein GspB n=1 Tax=Vibrio chaetopteri TaxID=3016528 RepID=UPI003AB60F9C